MPFGRVTTAGDVHTELESWKSMARLAEKPGKRTAIAGPSKQCATVQALGVR